MKDGKSQTTPPLLVQAHDTTVDLVVVGSGSGMAAALAALGFYGGLGEKMETALRTLPDSAAEAEPVDVRTFDDEGRITSMRVFWSQSDMRTV